MMRCSAPCAEFTQNLGYTLSETKMPSRFHAAKPCMVIQNLGSPDIRNRSVTAVQPSISIYWFSSHYSPRKAFDSCRVLCCVVLCCVVLCCVVLCCQDCRSPCRACQVVNRNEFRRKHSFLLVQFPTLACRASGLPR